MIKSGGAVDKKTQAAVKKVNAISEKMNPASVSAITTPQVYAAGR